MNPKPPRIPRWGKFWIAKCWRNGRMGGKKKMNTGSARAMLSMGLRWLLKEPNKLTWKEIAELLQDVLGADKPVQIGNLDAEQCRLYRSPTGAGLVEYRSWLAWLGTLTQQEQVT